MQLEWESSGSKSPWASPLVGTYSAGTPLHSDGITLHLVVLASWAQQTLNLQSSSPYWFMNCNDSDMVEAWKLGGSLVTIIIGTRLKDGNITSCNSM